MADGDKAIVIGIGRYPTFGADGRTPNDLDGAVPDAVDMADWLVTHAKATVTLVTSKGGHGEAWTTAELRPTETDVKRSFRPYLESGGARVARRLYVYMAGHGFAPEPRSRCLILADALGTTDVPNFEAPAWIDWFAQQYHFDELVLWMDCCAIQTYEYAPGRPMMVRQAARAGAPAKVVMAFGSGAGRAAYEGPVGPNGEIRGLFTEKLLRGLKGAAADENGEVRTASLKRFLLNGSESLDEGPRQAEASGVTFPQEDDLLFAKVVGAQLPTYRIRALSDNGQALAEGLMIELLDGSLQVHATAPVVQGWLSFRLGIGLYKLRGPGISRFVEIGAATPTDIG